MGNMLIIDTGGGQHSTITESAWHILSTTSKILGGGGGRGGGGGKEKEKEKDWLIPYSLTRR